MSKAYIFISNNTSQTLISGNQAVIGTAQHGFGCTRGQKTITVSGTNINLNSNGYFNIDIGSTISDSEAGNVTLSIYQDGNLIASGTETIATADNPVSISFPAGVVVRNCSSTLTIVVTATAGNPIVSNLFITVEKM